MLPDSTVPYFEKTMTHVMLRRTESVVIPVKFIRTHGALLSTPELSMTGPNGCSLPVMLKVRPPLYGRAQCDDRVFLSHGWREFVKENGVQVGDRVVFYMVKRSTFRVLVCSHPKLKAVFENAMLIGILPKKEEDSGLDDNRTPENVVSSEAPPPLKVYHRLVKLETAVPKCETNLIPAKTPIQQWHCGSPDKATAVAVKTSPTLGAERFVKHPKVAAAISLGSTFPQFVRKLTKSSLSIDGNSDIRLELPFAFVKEHGHKFQARVFLIGPNDRLRIVSLRILTSGRYGCRVQIRQGWKEFALENEFKEGDVLLFTLVAFSKFVVELSPSV